MQLFASLKCVIYERSEFPHLFPRERRILTWSIRNLFWNGYTMEQADMAGGRPVFVNQCLLASQAVGFGYTGQLPVCRKQNPGGSRCAGGSTAGGSEMDRSS